jgi:hypothetical protein
MPVRRLLGGLLCAAAWASAAAGSLFGDHSVLEVSLTGRFGDLFANAQGSDYQPFTLEVDGLRQEIRVRLRGHSRRRVCEFPPLRLEIPSNGAVQSLFAGHEQLKLVTHCRNQDRGEQDMLEEYLAYRVFNLLTPDSLKVRLLRFSYHDSEGRMPRGSSPRYGFLLEPLESLAARTGATVAALPGVPVQRHDLRQAALVYVFQYLIGNTDWSLVRKEGETVCCHNIELLERDGLVLVVPYDFDLAGIVNARYAFPDASLRIRRVTQRLYRGLCTDPENLRDAITAVNARRADIMALVRETPGLEPDEKEDAASYLEGYFKRAQDEERLLRDFEQRCLGR